MLTCSKSKFVSPIGPVTHVQDFKNFNWPLKIDKLSK